MEATISCFMANSRPDTRCGSREEGQRAELAGEHPVVGLHEDEGEATDCGGVAGEERVLGAFDVDLEDEGHVARFGLGGEDGGQGVHADVDARRRTQTV